MLVGCVLHRWGMRGRRPTSPPSIPSRYKREFNSANRSDTPTRYYLLNGQPIALRIGSQPVTHLYRDHLGSVVMTSQNGVITDTRQYFAYGSKRGGDELPFDANYTGSVWTTQGYSTTTPATMTLNWACSFRPTR